ncbi:hypothetical protein CVT26_009806 [Gymnopilus dilepis]|uniref:2-dehydropantoate 2-reductase n=1 Tax=Gymnopilus dilepis TaxID=231916 RepID=A0A409YI86_9AGAR|nr:hypothetical protein CVT26_009806 [Gymnopilus dilepis]
MHLHVLGLGSIGCLVAHNLRQILPASHTISLIHKSNRERNIFLQRGSITLERAGVLTPSTGEYLHEVFHSPKAESNAPIQSVIVALKAQYTIDAIKQLAPRIGPNSTIVLLQNGMGIYEELLTRIFRNPTSRPHFILASNTHGAFLNQPYHVVHAGVGSINFGIVPDSGGKQFEIGLDDPGIEPQERRLRLSDIAVPSDPDFPRYKSLRETTAALLLAKTLNVSWQPFVELQLAMRRKLVVNAVINPLTSLMQCRNGDLFRHSPAQRVLNQVCDEASAVYAAQTKSEIDTWLQDLERQQVDTRDITVPEFPHILTSESLREEVLRVAELTKGNISSMLQDVRRGRHTEIEFINGYLENLGKEVGVKTPAISMLRSLVELKHFMPLDLSI